MRPPPEPALRSPERENSRNGYRTRPWDTRVGTIELHVPKLRRGTYSPEVLLSPRRRAEQALVAVICQAYVEGVSTRRVDDLVKAMGIEGMSKSEVSRLAGELDTVVTQFKERPLDRGPYRYLWIDALTQRVREGGRVVNVSAVIATAVNNEGAREIVGFEIVTTEDSAAWTEFLRSLVARGLNGVELVISDAHGGIKAAIAQVLSGGELAALSNPFHGELADQVHEGQLADDCDVGAINLRSARPDEHLGQVGRGHQSTHPGGVLRPGDLPARRSRRYLGLQRLPLRTLEEDPLQQSSGAAQQGGPPRPTSSGSSPTVRRSSVSSARCSASRTTSGPSRGVT
ncbi:MAG: hypothetical protein HKL87_09190 [Acidimicrobiaceae bacterium]|nr:hypothetical protein [Acidimicrobiaceae bacterium]